MTEPTRERWIQVSADKRQQQRERINEYCLLVDSHAGNNQTEMFDTSSEILSINDSAALVQKIVRGDFTSQAVTKAYIERHVGSNFTLIGNNAKQVTGQLKFMNRLTEILFCQAIEQAQELDKYLAKEGKPFGQLHGIPVTLKDQFNVKDYDSTLGYTGRAFKPAEADAVLVKILKSLGAIILAKTNIPQSIMWCETENPLWGLTTNPIDSTYTPGGSTGGEAALLHMHGSMLGWGTDIGGSIRIPSHMMGLYGLKPSSSRLPYTGVPVSTEGQGHVPSSIGPLARSLSTLYHCMKSIISEEPWRADCRCVPLEWRQDMHDKFASRKLTIGLLLDDGVVRPHPGITRVVKSVARALSNAGHQVVDWDASLHAECIEVMDQFYTADGGEDIRRDVQSGGEPFIAHVERLINRGQAISVYQYWQLNRRTRALQQAYLEKWNNFTSPQDGSGVDVLLMPVMPHSAVPHKGCRWVGYTKVWNFLDYPALTIPGGKVEADDFEASWDYPARNEMDEWNMELWTVNKMTMAALGLPIGIQLVTRNLEEEKLLAIGKIVDELIHS